MVDYQTTSIKPGKWYVSELPTVMRLGPGQKAEITYQGAHNTRLAGPCDDEVAGKQTLKAFLAEHPQYTGRTYLWQCSGS